MNRLKDTSAKKQVATVTGKVLKEEMVRTIGKTSTEGMEPTTLKLRIRWQEPTLLEERSENIDIFVGYAGEQSKTLE